MNSCLNFKIVINASLGFSHRYAIKGVSSYICIQVTLQLHPIIIVLFVYTLSGNLIFKHK